MQRALLNGKLRLDRMKIVSNSRKRIIGVDLVKVFACFSVILLHTSMPFFIVIRLLRLVTLALFQKFCTMQEQQQYHCFLWQMVFS